MHNKWPLQKDCDAFYGNPRGPAGTYDVGWAKANLVHVLCPWNIYMGKLTVPYVVIHRKCAESLRRVLGAIWDGAGRSQKEIDRLKYSTYSGSFNYRPKRAGVTLSMHAYGAAIDWDAPDNPFQSKRHLFTPDSLLVVKFEEEDWIWGGRWSSPDAMHVQAARVR